MKKKLMKLNNTKGKETYLRGEALRNEGELYGWTALSNLEKPRRRFLFDGLDEIQYWWVDHPQQLRRLLWDSR